MSHWEYLKELAEQATKSGDYSNAETLWFAIFQTIEFDGESDPRLITTIDNLAYACLCQGKLADAKHLYWQCVTLKEKYMKEDAMQLARSLKNLAAIYYDQEKYDEALKLGERVLAIYEDSCGEEDPGVAEIALNLAILCHRAKHIEKAEQYYDRALAIKARTGQKASPTVVKPFADPTQRKSSTCTICGRQYYGEACLKCTLTTIHAMAPPAV